MADDDAPKSPAVDFGSHRRVAANPETWGKSLRRGVYGEGVNYKSSPPMQGNDALIIAAFLMTLGGAGLAGTFAPVAGDPASAGLAAAPGADPFSASAATAFHIPGPPTLSIGEQNISSLLNMGNPALEIPAAASPAAEIV